MSTCKCNVNVMSCKCKFESIIHIVSLERYKLYPSNRSNNYSNIYFKQ